MDIISDFDSFHKFIKGTKEGVIIDYAAVPFRMQLQLYSIFLKLKASEWKFENEDKESLLKSVEKLYSPDVPLPEKKELLVKMAFMDDVRFYKALKEFEKHAGEELKEWVKIVLRQSQVVMENLLGDENKILVFTGLGGKDEKIRYFGVFAHRDNELLSDYQRLVIKNELYDGLKSNGGILEKLYFEDFFAAFLFLTEFGSDVKALLRNILKEINVYGNFLRGDFLVTNIKILSKEEIVQQFMYNE